MKWILLLINTFFITSIIQAQELNCKVTVMHQRIQNVDKKIFQSLESALNNFLNNRKWTNDIFLPEEKIECSFILNLTSVVEENVYKGTLNVSASRPVFGTNYSTPLVTFIERDDNFVFKYEASLPLNYDDNNVNAGDPQVANLMAILAFYVNIILGLDYDSFSPLGGTEYFKKAQYITGNAPTENGIKGWLASEPPRNRFWLVDQILNPRFDGYRNAWYIYHREGLDQMASDKNKGIQKIFSVVPMLAKINRDNPSAYLLQFYFNAKGNEYINLISELPQDNRKEIIDMLSAMDVPNAGKYRAIK